MTKEVWVVTHGPKRSGGDPGMTADGMRTVGKLRLRLPGNIGTVHIGEAARHRDVCAALGLAEHPRKRYSSVWGACGSLDKELGPGGEKTLSFADGYQVPFDQVTSATDGTPSLLAKLRGDSVANNDVVCCGREVVVALGIKVEKAKSGALYLVRVYDHGEFTLDLVAVG